MKACSVETCERELYAKGLCNGHYQRARRGVALDAPFQRPQGGPCEVADCTRESRARGLCNAHLARLYTYGEVRADDPIGKHWRADYPRRRRRVGQRRRNTDGYVEVWDPEHPNAHATGWVLEHRRVMAEVLGRPLRPDEIPHHKNGDRADNRAENLELCAYLKQPPGQRVEDLVAWAREILDRYGDVG